MPASESQTLTWQLLVDPAGRPGAENMALDQALLDAADRTGASFLRLYRWSPSCLSFGRNEPALTRYDRAAIERLGLDVVRRPTGGRAVWHDAEVTYAVAAPVEAFGSLRESYCEIHRRLARALQSLGVPADLAPNPESRAPLHTGSCFADAVGGEVVVRGRKLVGSAQVRQGLAFLQHGSILLDGSQDIVGAISRPPTAASSFRVRGSITLREALGRTVAFEEVAQAIVSVWDDQLTVTAHYRPLPPVTAAFGSDWTWRR